MLTVSSVEALRDQVAQWKQQDNIIGFVPTMGNLHAGHLALIDRAKQAADKVVASIFVNPTQFGPNEDFDSYPRTMDADSEALVQHETDLLFTPSVETMYGTGGQTMMVHVPDELNDMLCGVSRPGHFNGVATVVSKLFNQVQPDIAVFGQKDFQQLAVIRQLVKDLAFPIEIIGHETMREADGLAMSSRNNYLAEQERQLAPHLQKALLELTEQIKTGRQKTETAIKNTLKQLEENGFDVEYVEIRRQSDLKTPELGDNSLVALVAAKLGRTRLIDNCLFELE
ncbi:MAG: pantoate--beta-alanine ligase [Gammaproteobacteria bacterium]|nr:pantoate--beta-alanine ligase [Gammaproteobacteria bacterium]